MVSAVGGLRPGEDFFLAKSIEKAGPSGLFYCHGRGQASIPAAPVRESGIVGPKTSGRRSQGMGISRAT